MKKRILTFGLIAVMALTTVTAMAASGAGRGSSDNQQWGKGKACRMKGPGNGMVRMLGKLDLTSDQQQQVDKLIQTNREKAQALRGQMADARNKLHKAMNSKTFDEKALRQAAAEKTRIQTELMVNRVRTHSQIYALLTPEQQELADLARNLERLRGHGHGHKKGFRDCPNPMGPRGPRNVE
jgi:protein CpxP